MSCAEQFIRKLLRKLNSPVFAHLLLHRFLQESMKSFVVIISRLCLPTLAVTFLFHRSEWSTLENTKGPFPRTVLPLQSSVRDSRATSSVMVFSVPRPEVTWLALSPARLVITPFYIRLLSTLHCTCSCVSLPFFMRFQATLCLTQLPVPHCVCVTQGTLGVTTHF